MDPLQGLRRGGRDPLPGRRRPGQRDEADIGMLDELRPGGLAVAADHVEDAGREDLRAPLGQLQGGDRGRLGRLQDDRVAGRQSRADLPDRHHQRVVPGGDLADHADRLAPDDRGVALHVLARRLALHAAGGAGEEAQLIRHRRDLVLEHRMPRLAGVGGLEVGDLIRLLLDQVGDRQQRARPLGGGGDAPVLERLLRRPDGAVDVLLGGERRLGDHLSGRGIDHVLGLPV